MDPPQMAESSGRFNASLSGSVNQESLQSLLVRQPQLQTFSCYRFPFATLLHIILTVNLLNVQTGVGLKRFFLLFLKKTKNDPCIFFLQRRPSYLYAIAERSASHSANDRPHSLR